MISCIDLQLGSLCNRACWFCPQQSTFKNNVDIEIDDIFIEKFILLIKDGLSNNKIHKDFYISLNRYYEPLLYLNKLLNVCIKLKKEFPNTRLETQTNGDLILDEFTQVMGYLDHVRINRYDDDLLKSKLYIFKHFNIKNSINDKTNNSLIFKYNNTNVMLTYNKESFLLNNNLMTNRGSSVSKLNKDMKKTICDIPGKILCIDVSGDIFACCDLHSSIPEHRKSVLGNLYKNDFNYIYDKMLNFNSLQFECCLYCNSKYEFLKTYNNKIGCE